MRRNGVAARDGWIDQAIGGRNSVRCGELANTARAKSGEAESASAAGRATSPAGSAAPWTHEQWQPAEPPCQHGVSSLSAEIERPLSCAATDSATSAADCVAKPSAMQLIASADLASTRNANSHADVTRRRRKRAIKGAAEAGIGAIYPRAGTVTQSLSRSANPSRRSADESRETRTRCASRRRRAFPRRDPRASAMLGASL